MRRVPLIVPCVLMLGLTAAPAYASQSLVPSVKDCASGLSSRTMAISTR